MTGVHGLKHVEGFRATALTDDDTLRTHPQRVLDKFGCRDCAFAFDVGRASFESNDMVLLQLQFRRILNRYDSIFVRNKSRKGVE